ncbi:MAG: FAD-dependent oxidoreductase [Actinomycetia bacterium]|nr:FAD-dependent oxidoreductase [Actinomycetes bacterium]
MVAINTTQHDVVIVGAGLAGLTAGRLLQRAGRDVLLLEGRSGVGGRVRTDRVEGFRLDHGFQVFNPAYPAAQRAWDYANLDLQSFNRGIEIVTNNGRSVTLSGSLSNLRDIAGTLTAGITGKIAAPWRLSAFAGYALTCAYDSPDRLRAREDVPLGVALQRWGLDRRVIDRLVVPFLSGVFGEADPLLVSRRYADFVLRTFVRGAPSVPADGMNALPQALAEALVPDSLQLQTTVHAVSPGAVQTAHGTVRGRSIVIATDAIAASKLLPGLQTPSMNSLSTWYFTVPEPVTEQYLMVDARTGPRRLSNVAVMTTAAPSYSTTGAPLIAATAVGYWPGDRHAQLARTESATILGVPQTELREVARYPIQRALPQVRSPYPLRKPVALGEGVFVIGDHRDTPSIQGALVSGERGAAAVLSDTSA